MRRKVRQLYSDLHDSEAAGSRLWSQLTAGGDSEARPPGSKHINTRLQVEWRAAVVRSLRLGNTTLRRYVLRLRAAIVRLHQGPANGSQNGLETLLFAVLFSPEWYEKTGGHRPLSVSLKKKAFRKPTRGKTDRRKHRRVFFISPSSLAAMSNKVITILLSFRCASAKYFWYSLKPIDRSLKERGAISVSALD